MLFRSLVARALAHRGALDDRTYDHVVGRNLARVPPHDLAVIACFSDLPAARHPDLLAQALRHQTVAVETPGDNGLRCVSARLHRDAARVTVALRHRNVVTIECVANSLLCIKNSLRGRPKENYVAFVLRGGAGASFYTTALLDSEEVNLNLDGPSWVRMDNGMRADEVYVLLVAQGYVHTRPPAPARKPHAASDNAAHAMWIPEHVPPM